MSKNAKQEENNRIIIFKTKDGRTAVDVKIDKETVWLNTHQMANLFGIDRTGIVKHIGNVYKTKELR